MWHLSLHLREMCSKQRLRTVGRVDVVLLRWPQEQERRDALARQEHPRLLLLDQDTPPPPLADCFEDWVRLPVSNDDLEARSLGLLQRVRSHQPDRPVLDPDGVLRRGGTWVSLPPVEARLMGALLERFGAVVSREHLARAGWPQGAPGRNALDVHMLRVRRRIAPLALVIKTVRSRGYLLEQVHDGADEESGGDVPELRGTA